MQVYKKQIARFMVAISAIALFGGCKKFLDREPLSIAQIDLNVGALEGKTVGLYGAIRNSAAQPYCGDGFQGIAYIAMNGFRSDDAEIVSDPGAGLAPDLRYFPVHQG